MGSKDLWSTVFSKYFQSERNTKDLPIVFKEFLYDPNLSKGMLHVIVIEDGAKQEFWVEIFKGTRQWLIRPSMASSFIPTRGIARALELIYTALQ